MRASAIVVAAGTGQRLGMNTPKAFVPLGGSTLLAASLRTCGALESIGEIVITVPDGMEREGRSEAQKIALEIPTKVIAGGAERQDSVRIALGLVSAAAELVVVHDAARPLATAAMFTRCIEQAAIAGAAIVALPVADTLKRVAGESIRETIPRTDLWQAQTPQVFRRDLLIEAHLQAARAGIRATDDADLVQRTGRSVSVVPGSVFNFKITTADDLRLAETLIAIGLHG